MGDTAKQMQQGISKPFQAIDEMSGSNMSSTYLNPAKKMGDLQNYGLEQTGKLGNFINQKQNIANQRDQDIREGQAAQDSANQVAAAAAKRKAAAAKTKADAKYNADQSAAAGLVQNDLNSAMMDAQAKADMAKRGRNKMYGSRLNVDTGGL